jgi:hypothetical protein
MMTEVSSIASIVYRYVFLTGDQIHATGLSGEKWTQIPKLHAILGEQSRG